jgi:hypothetical protein
MAGQPPFAVHISLTVNPESVYWDLAERLLISASISGGQFNSAGNDYSSVSGGLSNLALRNYSTVWGGSNNIASGTASSVSGGEHNTASGAVSSVSGGEQNTASGIDSTVSGGEQNRANGEGSAVSGGRDRTAPAQHHWAAEALFSDHETPGFPGPSAQSSNASHSFSTAYRQAKE